jgi:phage tail-like protein
MANRPERLPDAPFTGKFVFSVDGVHIGAFSEVSGLQVEVEVEEVQEGGQNHFVHKLPGRMSWPPLVLKRGIADTDSLFEWFAETSGEGFAGNGHKLERKEGEVVLFDGFLRLEEKTEQQEDGILPPVNKGDELALQDAAATETLSRGPARYTEASLVRQLEEMGIGRPSTYAPTISTIQDRGYVIKGDIPGEERELLELRLISGAVTEEKKPSTVGADKNKLLPTTTGNVVTDFLVKHFQDIVDFDFTKEVEEEFDHIAAGKQEWRDMLKKFYGPFHKTVLASENVSRAEASQARELGTDPKTGKPVTARYGRFGPMVQIGTAEDEDPGRSLPWECVGATAHKQDDARRQEEYRREDSIRRPLLCRGADRLRSGHGP